MVNVEDFKNVGRDFESSGHIGRHEHVWEMIASNYEVLKAVFETLKWKLSRYVDESAGEVWVVFVCAWGKHRSVGLAEMSYRIWARNGYSTSPPIHLSMPKWSKRKCGWQRCFCDDMNESKWRSLAAAERVWREVFAK